MTVDVLKDPFVAVFNPNNAKLSQLGLLGAFSLSNCVQSVVPVRLINISPCKINVNKDLVVGEVSVYNEEKIDDSDGIMQISDSDMNLDHLNPIIQSIAQNNTLNSEQNDHVFQLIRKNKSFFSTLSADIGFYSKIKHQINIKKNVPLQKILSKVPMHVEEWVDGQVKDLLKKGIIRASCSAWSVPIVVEKRNLVTTVFALTTKVLI